MPKTLEILHSPEQEMLQLTLVHESGERESAPAVSFPFPLSKNELDEISWLLYGYPGDPFGESQSRAGRVETGLRDVGRLLQEIIFRSSGPSNSILAHLTSPEAHAFQVSIVSSQPEFLSLPWELLNAPDVDYLLTRASAITRRTGSLYPVPEVATAELPDSQFNVLMLCLPGGNGISAESLEAMESLDVDVSLECLRPPAINALEAHLADRPGRYHLVHLDGVQVADEGHTLVGLGPVAAIAQSIAGAGVPVALMSTATPDYRDASCLAMARGGVPEVAAVPGPLGGSGRKLFADAFYAGIAQGNGASASVAAARRAMMKQPHRPSAAGPIVSWDWISPVVYQSAQYEPVAIRADEPEPAIPGMLPAVPESPPRQLPGGGPYGLIGRRHEVLELDRLFESHQVVILSGSVAIGKTELALGFAAWLEKNGGRPGGVFHTTFDVGAGLDKALHEIGTALAGLYFGDLPAASRRHWLLEHLRDHPTQLVWDGVENLAGFPAPGTGLLENSELSELDEFLAQLSAEGGKTRVLLVSRRPTEHWLTIPHATYQLGGLQGQDRLEFATRLIEESATDLDRLGPEFPELLELIEGHPLAMEIAVPLLKDVPSSVLLSELRRSIDDYQPGPGEEGRPVYLTAILEHSFSRMPRRSRTHLPFLSLFKSRVMMDILTHITQESLYRSVMGEQLGWGACRTLLRSARNSGFLEPVTPSVYQIHPSMGWFYGRALYRQLPPARVSQLEDEFVRVYADTADYFMESLYENQDSGTTAILAEEGNLTQALALSLESGQWDSAQLLVQPLAQVYRMQKRYPELRRLRRQLLDIVGTTPDEAAANGASQLWLYLLGTEASECIETNELGRADLLNRQLLDYFSSQPGSESDPRAAAVYHQVGQVALKRWELEDAEEWFFKSLAIIEDGEDRAPVADDYYSMGLVRQYQRRYSEARDWFSRSLDIHQRLEDVEEMVRDYRSLGLCAQFQV